MKHLMKLPFKKTFCDEKVINYKFSCYLDIKVATWVREKDIICSGCLDRQALSDLAKIDLEDGNTDIGWTDITPPFSEQDAQHCFDLVKQQHGQPTTMYLPSDTIDRLLKETK